MPWSNHLAKNNKNGATPGNSTPPWETIAPCIVEDRETSERKEKGQVTMESCCWAYAIMY